MPMSDLSQNLKEIEVTGYLIERSEVRRGLILLRARHDDLVLEVRASSDEEAAARLLAKVRNTPRPGSSQARAAAGREVLTHPDKWPPIRPTSGSSSN